MWVLMLLLVLALGAHARADLECDACIARRCHARQTLLEDIHVTDQLAIDRAHNTLYTQLNNKTILAYLLDEGTLRIAYEGKTHGLAFDQKNQLLYTSVGPIFGTFEYGPDHTSAVEPVVALDRPTIPVRLRYEDTLYTINADGSCGYRKYQSDEFGGYENLQDYVVTDMVNVKDITNWFFISDNKLFKFVISPTGIESTHLISDKRHVLSIGGHGGNYFVEPSQKVIYKLDRETGELKEYGTYKSGSVEDFVFDRDENIVFLDADGSVARWVPGQESCGDGTYRVDDFTLNDNLIIKLIRHYQDTSSSTPRTSCVESYSYENYDSELP